MSRDKTPRFQLVKETSLHVRKGTYNGLVEWLDQVMDAVAQVARPWANGQFVGETQVDTYSGLTYVWTPSGWQLLSPGTVQAIDYYVDSTSGDDSNDGSQSAPLRRVQEAFDRTPMELYHQVNIRCADGSYDESLQLANKHQVGPTGGLNVIGRQDVATLTTGPTTGIAVTAGARNYLDAAPVPAWTTYDMRNKFVVCTAGPNAGRTAPIAYNTGTRIYTDSPGTLWQVGDVFDIYECKVHFQNNSVFLSPTLRLADITLAEGPWVPTRPKIQFTDIFIEGDFVLRATIWTGRGGNVSVEFVQCYIQNDIHSWVSGGQFYFDTCGLNTNWNGGSIQGNQPGALFAYQFVNCAAFTTYWGDSTGKNVMRSLWTNWFSNSGTFGAIFVQGSSDVFMGSNDTIDGRGQTRRCIVISGRWNGVLEVNGSHVLDSFSNGIETQYGAVGTILLDGDDIRGHAQAGIHIEGNIFLTLSNNISSVPNGTFGMVLRNGAKANSTLGGNTVSGATNDLDLGAGSQIAWGAVPHTNPTELTRVS